jgi:hypothetical protein
VRTGERRRRRIQVAGDDHRPAAGANRLREIARPRHPRRDVLLPVLDAVERFVAGRVQAWRGVGR